LTDPGGHIYSLHVRIRGHDAGLMLRRRNQTGRNEQMTRNLKALGLALIAVFAMSAVAASAAQAKFDTLTTFPTTNVFLTAKALATQEFAIQEGKATVKCSEVELETGEVEGSEPKKFKSTNTDKSTSITAYPKYNKTENTCEVSPFGKGTVHMNGCYYTFTSETDVNGDAEVHIICPPGQKIVITGPGSCNISVGEQTVKGVHYTNETTSPGTNETEMHIKLEPTVKAISWTATAPCALIGIKSSGTDGTYNGNVTVTADQDVNNAPGEPAGITVSTLKEGEAMP
jgi:hypothetical protein